MINIFIKKEIVIYQPEQNNQLVDYQSHNKQYPLSRVTKNLHQLFHTIPQINNKSR